MESFLEKNKDFVLKLKIKTGVGDPQIRRVALPRIADSSGNVSYEELVGLVLTFSLPEEDAAAVNSTSYSVSLMYYDDEKDLITLASTEELMDAINLFAERGFVRISTRVKPKISYSAPPVTAAPPVKNITSPSLANRGMPANDEKLTPTPPIRDPPIRDVLESFAGILSTAVNNLQEGLSNGAPVLFSGEDLNRNPSAVSPSEKRKEVPSKAKVAKNRKGQKGKAAIGGKVGKLSNSVSSNKSLKVNSSGNKEKFSSGCSNKAKESEETQASEPFIHGRHTCDSCLTTPIFGKRYHSTNLEDYDLCQRCFDNYKGSEIQFESVELRRDVAFQNRWRQRHQTYKKVMASRRGERPLDDWNSKCAPGAGQGGRSNVSSTEINSSDFYVSRSNETNADINQASNENAYSSNEFDNLLKEAIRRSLDDVVPKEDSTAEEYVLANIVPLPEDGKPPIDFCNDKKQPTEQKVPIRRSLDDVVLNGDSTAAENPVNEELVLTNIDPSTVEKKQSTEHKVPEDDVGEAKDDIPRSVDIMEHETDEIPRLVGRLEDKATCVDGASTLEYVDTSLEFKDVENMQNVMDTDSVDSEKLLSESSKLNASPFATADLPKTPVSKHKKSGFSKDESFASDAIGNGDVAELMGKTLDMVAGVVSEMLDESDDVETLNENGKLTENESKQGELVLDSNNSFSEAGEEEDDTDWSLVKSIGSSGTTDSKKIGKAAEMLGSALFNSDMRNSFEDNRSNLIGSDSSLSIPSSVPTVLGTVNSQVSRWATELEKLQELGFSNKSSCIEVLERIGSKSNTAETNIQDVVDELLLLNA